MLFARHVVVGFWPSADRQYQSLTSFLCALVFCRKTELLLPLPQHMRAVGDCAGVTNGFVGNQKQAGGTVK